MVNSNRGLPEPPTNTEENFSPNGDIIVTTDTDTEEDVDHTVGYEPLPLEPPDDNQASDSEDDCSENVSTNEPLTNDNLPSIPTMEASLVQEVWCGGSSCASDIEMDSMKVNEVKQAMMNFTLPASAIPEWVKSVPEEQWKEHLLNRLQNLQKRN